jgi:hypothetical protein
MEDLDDVPVTVRILLDHLFSKFFKNIQPVDKVGSGMLEG